MYGYDLGHAQSDDPAKHVMWRSIWRGIEEMDELAFGEEKDVFRGDALEERPDE